MSSFEKSYCPHRGDICVRMLKPDRFEISEYNAEKGEWHKDKILSLAEIEKQVRSTCSKIGEHGAWEYYRAGV